MTRGNPLPTVIRLVVAGAAVGLTLLVSGGSAAAAPSPGQGPTNSQLICSGTTGGSSATASQNGYALLPIDRWGATTGTMHTYYVGGVTHTVTEMPAIIQRNVEVGTTLSFANTLWSAGAGLTEMASRFCFAGEVGGYADKVAAGIGQGLEGNASVPGAIGFLVVIGIFVAIMRGWRRGDSPWKQTMKTVVVLGVLATMVAGASASTYNPSTHTATYGKFSPGWVITHLYSAIGTVANAPASAVLSTATGPATTSSSVAAAMGHSDANAVASDPIGCDQYTAAILRQYQASFANGTSTSVQAVVPESIDAMWEQSGLVTYAIAQFGDNRYAPRVYCRLLEDEAGVPDTVKTAIQNSVPGSPKAVPDTLAFLPAGASSTAVDQSMIGWAACRWVNGAWQAAPSWADVTNPGSPGSGGILGAIGIAPSASGSRGSVDGGLCTKWWGQQGFNGTGSALDWDPGANIGAATGPHNQIANFLLNLHGDQNGGAVLASLAFALAAIVVLAVFAILAGAVLIAKIALIFLIVLFVVFLVVELFPTSGPSKVVGFIRQAVSYSILATAAGAIMALVAVMTSMIADMGTSVAGAGSVLSIVWLSFAPVTSIVVLHHLFKAARVPSPFKLSSALAWGAAGGGIGAGLAIGAERLAERGRGYGKGAVSGAVRRGASGFGANRQYGPMRRGLSLDKGAKEAGIGATQFGQGRRQAGSGTTAHVAPQGGAPAGPGLGASGSAGTGASPDGTRTMPNLGANSMHLQRLKAVREGRAHARQQRREGRTGLQYAQGLARERWDLARERFMQRPVRNGLKLAGGALAAAALPVGLPLGAAAVAGAYGWHKVRQARREAPMNAMLRQRAQLEAYERKQAADAEARAAAEAAAEAAAAAERRAAEDEGVGAGPVDVQSDTGLADGPVIAPAQRPADTAVPAPTGGVSRQQHTDPRTPRGGGS